MSPPQDGGQGQEGGDASDAGDAQSASDASDAGDAASDSGACDPSAYPFPGSNGCPVTAPCDTGLAATGAASEFVKALGLCAVSTSANTWGVVSATYTSGHTQGGAGAGSFALQHGILATFGDVVTPREGAMFGVLSTGSASVFDTDKGPLFKGLKDGMQGPTSGDLPTGFPRSFPGCPAPPITANDIIDLKLQLRVPANAHSFSFDFDVFSSDWPENVCSGYSDQFIAYLRSSAFDVGAAGNVAFDSAGNPVSVNGSFFAECTPGVALGCNATAAGTSTCVEAASALAGTGFGLANPPAAYCGTVTSTSGAATGWLRTTAPAQPGEVLSLELIISDTGDASWDSSVLLDHFQWLEAPSAQPVTGPAPPK